MFAKAEDFPLAIADHEREFPGEPLRLQNISWFSHYACPQNGTTLPRIFSENFQEEAAHKKDYLKASQKLAAMLEGARKLLSWLTPVGFSDIHFLTPLEMPPGIARECRLECHPLYWINHERKMTRLVNCRLDARKISSNGRRLNEYEVMTDGYCYLCAKGASPKPVGEFRKITAADLEIIADSGVLIPENAENSGLRLCKVGKDEWQGLAAAPVAPIAMRKKGSYAEFFRLFDCVVEAARLTLNNPEFMSKFHCAGVGYLNFNIADYVLATRNSRDHLVFYLKLVLLTDKFFRFNVQVGNEAGKIFLAAHNLEFEKNQKKTGMEPTH